MTMALQCWNSASSLTNPNLSSRFSDSRPYYLTSIRKSRKASNCACLLKLGVEDIAQIAHNKVLIAAGLSAAIGQLLKPFTSILLYGKDFDFKTAFQAGGFPSTHSSSAVAAATSLALERGFSDSIFGLAVVYAGLLMYDAQGVRREVGNHAKALNALLTEDQVNSVLTNSRNDLIIDSQHVATDQDNSVSLLSEEERPLLPNSTIPHRRMLVTSCLAAAEEATKAVTPSSAPLKESIGHTEIEVIAGALLGFLVGLGVYTIS